MTMSPIDPLRAREFEFERQLARLLGLIDDYPGADGALAIEVQLTRIVGQWRVLFVQRERLVYGPATRNGDAATAAHVADCRQKLEAMADQVEEFARRWSSSALIASALPGFRAAALVLVTAIAALLDREQQLLNGSACGAPRLVA